MAPRCGLSSPAVNPFVDVDWLIAHRDSVAVADVRWYLDGRSGRAAYEAGHLPGAVFVELGTQLAGPPSPAEGRHPLPDPERFARSMSELGIGDGDAVVAYDDAGGVIAARLVWMLRALDVAAALLDGGIQAFPGELERGSPSPARASFTPRPWPAERLATLADVTAPGGALLLDARDGARYRGEHEPIDPRPGHIPGALSLPARENLDASGRLRPTRALRERFAEAGVSDGADVIAYCGSGLTACHDLLALELAGFGRGRLFPGSWSQYSSDPSRPAALGPNPAGPG